MKKTMLITFGVFVLALVCAIAFGGPSQPPAMASINNPFNGLDYSTLPASRRYTAADGAMLAYREYVPAAGEPRGSVVLLHGSSANGRSMHTMAESLVQQGWRVFTLDVRGHGASGTKGQIDYIGQLEDDLAAFMQEVKPPAPATLVGFSSGGGFALRFAGSDRQALFQSYLFLSPFISQDSPTYRPGVGGWANVGIPRIIGLAALNVVGIHALNGLPVTSFALDDEARRVLTPEYAFNLAMNYRPQRDFMANLRAAKQPCAVLAGVADEAFYTDKLEALVRSAGQDWPVQLLPGIQHIPLMLDPLALQAIATNVATLQKKPG